MADRRVFGASHEGRGVLVRVEVQLDDELFAYDGTEPERIITRARVAVLAGRAARIAVAAAVHAAKAGVG